MSFVKTKDGVEIFYKDWGQGQPIVFHHGWPLSSGDWDTQMLFFVHHGYRVVGKRAMVSFGSNRESAWGKRSPGAVGKINKHASESDRAAGAPYPTVVPH